MALNQVNPEPIQMNDDDSSIHTANTPPEPMTTNLLNNHNPLGGAEPISYLVPWPNSGTFIIRSVSSGHVITLLDGQITLTQPSGRSSTHWVCEETRGWLGFRNFVSWKLLGHDEEGTLRCSARWHRGWEYFCVRMRPEGGCVLLMTHHDRLWHVGIKVEQGVEKLAKIGDGGSGGMVWEFVKV